MLIPDANRAGSSWSGPRIDLPPRRCAILCSAGAVGRFCAGTASNLGRIHGSRGGMAEYAVGMVDHCYFIGLRAASCILVGGYPMAPEISARNDRRASHDLAAERAWLLHLARRWSAE